MKLRAPSKAGKISILSLCVFIVAFIYMNILIASGQKGGNTFLDNPLLALGGTALALSGMSAFFSGIVATFKDKDKSLLVFISTIIGFFVTMFLVSEVVFPH